MKYRTVFFGSNPLAIPTLEALLEGGQAPALIITTGDRPAGRGNTLTEPPAKTWANEHGIDLIQTDHMNEEIMDALQNTEWDLFIVASWGMIIPQAILDIPRSGTLNVHPSLLPKYRGASPMISQILADDPECGVTIMLMDDKMDHGPILAQGRITIDAADWPLDLPTLEALLAEEGGRLLVETIPQWMKNEITPEEQDHAKATKTAKITKEDGQLDLTGDARKNYLKICAFASWPGTFFFAKRKNGQAIRVKIADASLNGDMLTINRVIPEGKKEMAYEDFLRGL
jgi:methionyl-tRNA formyltransferase